METAVLDRRMDELEAEFDLDIRISVIPDPAEITAGFSTWQSCKTSCDSLTSVRKCC